MTRTPWFLTLRPRSPECRVPQGGDGRTIQMPVLCDVVGVIGSEIALLTTATGQWSPWTRHGVEDPALRRVVATAGAPSGSRSPPI